MLVAVLIGLLGCSHTFTTVSTPYFAEYCKVWGFLKYYHPTVTHGKLDWDAVFLMEYPKAARCTNSDELVEVVGDLLQAAGGVRSYGYRPMSMGGELSLVRRSWKTDARYLTAPLAESLDSIWSNLNVPAAQAYVGEYPAQNPDVSMDTSHYSDAYPSEAVRALALARYWNIIEYFAPDKDVIGEPWDSVLVRFIPKVIEAKNREDYTLTMMELCSSIHDSHSYTHSSFSDSLFGYYTLPFRPAVVDGRVVVARRRKMFAPALSPGDEIISIAGVNVDSLRARYAGLVPSSNPASRDRNVCRMLNRTPRRDSVAVVYRSASGVQSCNVKPLTNYELEANRETDTAKHWKIMAGNIGYVHMGKLTKAEADRAMTELINTKAIVFDVRNYPQGTMYEIGKYLDVKTPWVAFRHPTLTYPGHFETEDYNGPMLEKKKLFRGKVVILTNEETQSHAEFTCMMLQAVPGATVIGSQTAGADGNVTEVKLPGGITTMFSGLGVFYPNGKPTQRVGIVPDIEVHPTIAGLRAGRDEVLEKAMEIARK